jgi:DNA-binding Xre family transcriptional regulator
LLYFHAKYILNNVRFAYFARCSVSNDLTIAHHGELIRKIKGERQIVHAQYWGVPQRRRRIYLVADFAGRSAGDILFKSEGLSGYSAESFRAWQRTANGAEDCPGTAGIGLDGYNGSVSDKAATLGVNCGMSTGRNGVVLNDQGGSRMDVTDDVTCTLRAEAHHPPCVLDTIPLENHPNDGRIKIEDDGKVQTLSSRMGTGGNNVPLVMKMPTNWDGGQISPTLTKQNAGGSQRISFQKLFAIMEERDISRKQLCEMTGLSPATITKMGKDGNVNSSVLDKICMALGCKIGDIVSFVPADKTDDA